MLRNALTTVVATFGTTVVIGGIILTASNGVTVPGAQVSLMKYDLAAKPNKCVSIHFEVTPKGDINDGRVSGCGATPHLNPSVAELRGWLNTFTAVAPQPSMKGNVRWCNEWAKFGDAPTYPKLQLLNELAPAAFNHGPNTQGDWKHFEHVLLQGQPAKVLRSASAKLFHDCNWDS